MTTQSLIRSMFNRLLAPLDCELVRRRNSSLPTPRWTMKAALRRAAGIGICPATMIDVGAASGAWSQIGREVFPLARGLLIEPLQERRVELDTFVADWSGTAIETVVAGSEASEVTFNITADHDGSGVYGLDGGGTQRTLPQLSVDELVSRHNMPGPYLLKLDTHGYEIPILSGASSTLAETELIVVEVYGFLPAPTAVCFWELCSWLQEKGFRPSDITDLMGRQRDGMFWQADMFFLRDNHPVFKSNSYS